MLEKQIQEALEDFRTKLISTHLGINIVSNATLKLIFQKIIALVARDYEMYRKYIGSLLHILEENDDTAIDFLVASYMEYYDRIIAEKNPQKWDQSVFKLDYEVPEKLDKILETAFKANPFVRISDFKVDLTGISTKEKEGLISGLVDVLEDSAKQINWNEDKVQDAMLHLALLKDLLEDRGDRYSIFFLVSLVLDRFASSQFFQQSRDLSEELLLTSYNNSFSHLGYLNYFRSYLNNSSVISGLLYGNLSLSVAVSGKEIIFDKFIKDIISQSIKFFRNISFYPMVSKLYLNIPGHINFNKYERRSLAHSYFLNQLRIQDKSLPSQMIDFLNEHREEILSTGVNDALPWLITLYNVRRIYPETDFEKNGLAFYVTMFESIVPADKVKEYKSIIEGDSKKIKPQLRQALVKLHQTRNSSDVVQDNEMAIRMASRSIESAVKENDVEMLLLAMIVKSDYSFIFSEKNRAEIAPLEIPKENIEAFENIYGSGSETIKNLKAKSDYAFLWLITTESQYYQLVLTNGNFTSKLLENWEHRQFTKLINSDYFSGFEFDDSIKTATGVRMVFPDEHQEESDNYKKDFSFASIDIEENKTPLLLVMDNDFAGFPHNLFLNQQGDFVYIQRPVCNILSTEWYLKYANQTQLSADYSKAIWIPIEGGDFSINHLYAKLKDFLEASKFKIETAISPAEPIVSDINILTAHGANDIAIKQIIFPDGNPRINLAKFLGGGKVLILFICHSGSVKSTPFKNSISTIIKEYITTGYSAVIAPFWALHINIPPIWLPIFLKSLETDKTIAEAVQYANMKVMETYPTLAAWACMHLYGDPNITINK